MIIKAPWSLAPESIDTSVKIKITGGTVTIIDGEVTKSKSNGEAAIKGLYSITNPVIESWSEGLEDIKLLSNEIIAENG